MEQKRVLVIQDISCVGKCSMTIALPVLAAFGHETCILPTAVLSTHTGGFGTPAVILLGNRLEPFWRHWAIQGIRFDAILTGYLGSTQAVESAMDVVERLLAPGGICIVDPAMADHGKLYSGLDLEYARAIKALCRRADMILPNLTEAAMLAELSPEEPIDIPRLMAKLEYPCAIVTGVAQEDNRIAVFVKDGTEQYSYVHPKVGRDFHGTGDFFAACFTGALLLGKGKKDALQLSCCLTQRCMERTMGVCDPKFGLKFESVLPEIGREAARAYQF